MKELELSPRLLAIARQVPQGAKLADVGTDHAYLPVWLLRQGVVSSALATDLREGPLERGRAAARQYGAEGLTFRRCDGLTGIGPQQADTVVIAGMGGELIARILAEAPWTRQVLLLLQPMSATPELRRWLGENGYRIVRETIAPEGEKYYVILTVRGGEDAPYSLGELWAGRQRREQPNPHRTAYLEDLLARREWACRGMEKAANLPGARLERERQLLAQLAQLREEWIQWQP